MILAPGTVLQGRYTIVRLIGQGGMGAVYEAEDGRIHGRVALKHFLVAAQLDEGMERRMRRAFEREAQLLHRLSHSALPHISNYFATPEGQFLVMDFIEGDDLDTLIQRRGMPFPVAQVLDWGATLLEVLSYLHRRQPPILHRDIKPQNIKLTPDGRLTLLDFGLARETQLAPGATVSAVVGYTPHYAPLEQIQGSGISERSDLYAVGATLYRLLTDTVPPDALARAALVLQGDADPLRPPAALNPAVPQALSDLLLQTLALNPDDRPASASELRERLQSIAPAPEAIEERRGTRTSPESISAPERIGLRYPKLSLLLALIVVVLIAWISTGRQLDVGWSEAEDIPEEAYREKLAFIQEREICIIAATSETRCIRQDDTLDVLNATWSPSGSHIAFTGSGTASGDREIYVMRPDGQDLRRLTIRLGYDSHPSWSPDEQQILFSSELDSTLTAPAEVEIHGVAAFGTAEQRTIRSEPLREIAGPTLQDRYPAVSPDGTRIAFFSNQDGGWGLYVMDADGGNRRRIAATSLNIYGPSWSPDGTRIAFNSRVNSFEQIHVIDADGSNQTRLTHTHMNRNEAPAWSPDGQHIAFSSYRDGNWEIYLMNADGSGQTRVTKTRLEETSPTWVRCCP